VVSTLADRAELLMHQQKSSASRLIVYDCLLLLLLYVNYQSCQWYLA